MAICLLGEGREGASPPARHDTSHRCRAVTYRVAMTFGTLALLVAAGLVGPALSSLRTVAPPTVVGEIIAGVVIGTSGFGWLDPNDVTLRMFADVGFAMLMFVVGTHLPLRNQALRPALARGALVAITAGGLALGVGWLVSSWVEPHRPLILAVLVATSSAAVAMPILQESGRTDHTAMVVMSWLAIADVATVLVIPLVLSSGSTARVVTGGLVVITGTVAAGWVAVLVAGRRVVRGLREASRERGWALDLRVSLLMLFVAAWLATRFGTSILIAGFATGALVAVLGEPRRVAQQLIGLGEGFFVPIFFVELGARLDLGALFRSPRALILGVALLAGAVLVHVTAAGIWRIPLGAGLLATAQLGVPSAIVTIGLRTGELTPAQAAAIMTAVLGSLAVCAVGANLLGYRRPIGDHVAPAE